MVEGKHRDLLRFIGSMLMFFAPMLPALLASALVANFIAHSVKPARLALDKEAQAYPDTDYASLQRSFSRALLRAAAVSILLLVLGALIPFKLP